MRYSGITTCDIVNGEGIGVVLWVQGCDLHCPGCHNPESWDFSVQKEFTESDLDLILKELRKPFIDRLTISGGHPLAPANLSKVTQICKRIKQELPEITIWVWTGYYFENIKDLEVLNYIDVLVDGPYIQEQRDVSEENRWRGSSNQRVIDVPKSLKKHKTIYKKDTPNNLKRKV